MDAPLRYCETDELHRDFHRSLNGTIAHVRKTHGMKFLADIFKATAQQVYQSIWNDLKRGDTAQLVAHWRHFFDREGGRYRIREKDGEIELRVTRCPAIAYLRKEGIRVDRAFCSQTRCMNAAWSEDTPFRIETTVLGNGQCRQVIRLRRKKAGSTV